MLPVSVAAFLVPIIIIQNRRGPFIENEASVFVFLSLTALFPFPFPIFPVSGLLIFVYPTGVTDVSDGALRTL